MGPQPRRGRRRHPHRAPGGRRPRPGDLRRHHPGGFQPAAGRSAAGQPRGGIDFARGPARRGRRRPRLQHLPRRRRPRAQYHPGAAPDQSILVGGASYSLDFPLVRPFDDQPALPDGFFTPPRRRRPEHGLQHFLRRLGRRRCHRGGSRRRQRRAGGRGDRFAEPAGGRPAAGRRRGRRFAARLEPVGVARFLPWRTVALAEPEPVPAPYDGVDLDGDGLVEGVATAANPLAPSSVLSAAPTAATSLAVSIGTLGGITIAGVADVDRDGENELVVDDPFPRPRLLRRLAARQPRPGRRPRGRAAPAAPAACSWPTSTAPAKSSWWCATRSARSARSRRSTTARRRPTAMPT